MELQTGPSSRTTMRDVAERAQVSLKTVSRVINGEPGVASATAARVTESIAELGFRRNDLARSLRQGSTSATLGLVIEDVANPFYSAVAQAVESAARERGYLLITGSCEEDPDRERELIEALMGRRVDALLLVPAGRERDHQWLEREVLETTPVVFLDRPPHRIEADTVLLDNAGGARKAVEHLLASGHRRIAYVGDVPDLFTAGERLAGYRAALTEAGVEADPRLIFQDAPSGTSAPVDALLQLPADARPTAIFTGNNRHTVGAVRALRGREHEVALVGFDDFELAELLAMPTTVVRHDSFRMGAEAAALAFARLDGSTAPPQRLVLDTELVARGSGEVPPSS
ncbi:MAG: LacI family transcriptional regulator [Thermoleophilaceae bacterium]|nr:LacI family transcriptional regulator [Thermoleophilaceae bacterium]